MKTLFVLIASTFAPWAAAADFSVAPTSVSSIFRWSVQIGTGAARINPTLYLARGHSYSFSINTSSFHPFWIKTINSTGPANAYTGGGLSANDVIAPATITFNVPEDAPDALFYDCGNHASMNGAIDVVIFRDGFGD